jgi:hypothetical protein
MVEYWGGHPFDTVGEVPSEPAVSAAVVGFFVRTLREDRPLARSA